MKCIEHTMKENLLLLKDFLDTEKQDFEAHDSCFKKCLF